MAVTGSTKVIGSGPLAVVPYMIPIDESGNVIGAGLAGEVQGDVAHDAVGTSTNPVLTGGYASAAAPADVSADGDAVRAWALRNGAAAVQVTAAGALVGGDATNGLDVDVTRLPALPAGTNNIGDVDVLTLPAATNAGATAKTSDYDTGAGTDTVTMMGLALPASGGAVAAPAEADNADATAASATTNKLVVMARLQYYDGAWQRVRGDASAGMYVQGGGAHGAVVSGQPLLNGAEGRSTFGAAVDSGDAVRLLADLLGAQVVLPYALSEATWQYASAADIVDTTAVEMKAAVASNRNYVTAISLSNTDATVGTVVEVRSATTVIDTFYLPPQLAATTGVPSIVKTYPVPLRGGVNEAINVACLTTSAQVRAGANGFTKAV